MMRSGLLQTLFQMVRAFFHGWKEGADAAAMGSDGASRFRLRSDFFFSRLLKWSRLPGYYNAIRTVRMCGFPISYRFNRGDLQSLREVIIEEVYALDASVPCHRVLDLGANIGLYSLWLAHRIEGGQPGSAPLKACQLLAVEPVPANADVVRMNFTANQIHGEVICAAVGQQSGEAWFEGRNESNLGQLVMNDRGGQRAGAVCVRVPVVGIRELLARFPGGQVDLVKMDIEGGEADLLGHDLDWLANVGALVIEWHDDRADSGPLLQNLIKAGFRHHRINSTKQDNLSLLIRSDWQRSK